MFTAKDAHEAAKGYYAKMEVEEQKNAEIILVQILEKIKAVANQGMRSYSISNSRESFKTRNCEERVLKKLQDVGFNIKNGKTLLITW